MFRLVQYIFRHIINLRFGIRKTAISILPIKFAHYPLLRVYKLWWIGFYIPCHIRNRHGWMKPNKNMYMIRVAIDSKSFWFVISNNTANVFFNFIPVFFVDKIRSALYGEYYLDIELGVGICHGFVLFRSYAAGYKTNKWVFYKDFAPLGLLSFLTLGIAVKPTFVKFRYSRVGTTRWENFFVQSRFYDKTQSPIRGKIFVV